ncbi:hypothetical protein D043_0691A, partial [Vibrio parahaemolyticus EKP-021]
MFCTNFGNLYRRIFNGSPANDIWLFNFVIPNFLF